MSGLSAWHVCLFDSYYVDTDHLLKSVHNHCLFHLLAVFSFVSPFLNKSSAFFFHLFANLPFDIFPSFDYQ